VQYKQTIACVSWWMSALAEEKDQTLMVAALPAEVIAGRAVVRQYTDGGAKHSVELAATGAAPKSRKG
jgi:hypothetical protein